MLDLRALGVRSTDVGAIETNDTALLLKHLRLEPAALTMRVSRFNFE